MANDVPPPRRRDSPIVETASRQSSAALPAGGIHAFKGILYGASTEGHNRFMPAQAAGGVVRRARRARIIAATPCNR